MEDYKTRIRIYALLILLVVGLLVLRLVKLQLFDASAHTGESRSNSLREQVVLPARGMFYDRNGVLLVENEPAYSIYVTPFYFDDANIELLARLLHEPDSVVSKRVADAREWSSYRASPLATSVTFEVLGNVLEFHHRLPGVTYEVHQKRNYRTRARASHVLGYVREISQNELNQKQVDGYRRGDLVGSYGLERTYEFAVRGQPGSEFKLVNIRGQVVDSYLEGVEDLPPENGYDLHLTLDSDMQALAESLFVNKRGGLVAMDPRSGEILAMHSAPDFDLDLFTGRLDPETWQWLNSSSEKPQFNRATQSILSPGSTFKPFVALMALQEGVIDENYRYTCRGGHPRGRGQFFTCLDSHGSITVEEAIKQSCNTFFFEMMRIIDVNTFSRHAHAFGFGDRVPIDMPPSEVSPGIVPDSSIYDRMYGQNAWNAGTTMNLGIGQGEISVTPLQLVRYISALGNGGTLPTPHLVRKLVHPVTGEEIEPDVAPAVTLNVNPAYVDLVSRGMRRVIAEKSTWLDVPGMPIAGKTGTAQNSRGKDDSVFVMYAPADDPVIAIAVLIENAGYGSTIAGPIATLLAEKYVTGEIGPQSATRWALAMNGKSDPLPD